MIHLDFLEEILTTDFEYWVVAKRQTARRFGQDVQLNDSIIFIKIPQTIRRGLKPEEITLKEIKALNDVCIDCNIYINENYPPFQRCQTLNDCYKGYPITKNIKDFVVKAIEMNESDIWKYQSLIKAIFTEL